MKRQNVKTSNVESRKVGKSGPSTLDIRPSTSTKRQHQTLVIAGRRRGFELAEIRKMVGGSITHLSTAECSQWIEHFTGKGLPNPPGKKPSPYQGKPAPGTIRMITRDHIEQIARLMLEYFDYEQGFAWLKTNFKVDAIRALGTGKRASEVIKVLKDMLARREAGGKRQNVKTSKSQNVESRKSPLRPSTLDLRPSTSGAPHAQTIG